MRPSTRLRLVVLATVATFVAASCGASVPRQTVDSLRAEPTTVVSTVPGPTTTTNDPTTTVDDDPPVTATGGDFCDEMAKFADVSADTDDDFGLEGEIDDISDADLEKMKAGFALVDETFSAAAAAAPAEIADDMDLMASLYSDLNDAIASADSAEDLFGAIFSLAFGDVDETELDAAADRISTYTLAECGIDLEMD